MFTNNAMEKDKKTLTISTNLKKIDTSSISTQGKKSFRSKGSLLGKATL